MEHIETSDKICKGCKYGTIVGTKFDCCMYYLMTGNLRGCETGTCDKYEKRTKKRKSE